MDIWSKIADSVIWYIDKSMSKHIINELIGNIIYCRVLCVCAAWPFWRKTPFWTKSQLVAKFILNQTILEQKPILHVGKPTKKMVHQTCRLTLIRNRIRNPVSNDGFPKHEIKSKFTGIVRLKIWRSHLLLIVYVILLWCWVLSSNCY